MAWGLSCVAVVVSRLPSAMLGAPEECLKHKVQCCDSTRHWLAIGRVGVATLHAAQTCTESQLYHRATQLNAPCMVWSMWHNAPAVVLLVLGLWGPCIMQAAW